MAILTDLPNELLLSIIADVSPIYIESFALSCKRIYELCEDTIIEYKQWSNRLARLQEIELLRSVLNEPHTALYPQFLKLLWTGSWGNRPPADLLAQIDTLTGQSPYTVLHRTNAKCTVGPLLITLLLNVKRIEFTTSCEPNLLDLVSHIVTASHNPSLALREPLALGRLREARVFDMGNSTHGMELTILLATIPTVRKLEVILANTETYTFPHHYQCSGVTNMILDGFVNSSFLVELMRRTNGLEKFAYKHLINCLGPGAKLEPRRLVELLKQRARSSLNYLKLLSEKISPGIHFRDLCRNHNDLSLGSLRDFTALKILVTGVDFFIKTRGHSEYKNGTGTVQRLVSWLPASLETLVLHQGLEKWNKEDLRLLFRGFRNKKHVRLPNLKRINFVGLANFKRFMPDDIKAACQEKEVRLGYTFLLRDGDHYQASEELQEWEGRPWIEALGACCVPIWSTKRCRRCGRRCR
ncbi:hypothetical protein IMSHALPRED_001668 [Imshaugia aleurites]|uniref:F-box domain-containing protein n=1 Tax=Imshaugia aleurites TaxID=172621 RepID=A0A8H3PG32_9LECA|nr:hypothetical protein IMSHALPRED_001668 [Imshaugia aleurites]